MIQVPEIITSKHSKKLFQRYKLRLNKNRKMKSKLILAKPTGISLKEHVDNVLQEANYIIEAHPFVFKKFKNVTQKDLDHFLLESAKYHDDGKKHIKWQNACYLEYYEYLQSGEVSGNNLRKTGLRHEMESLLINNKKKLEKTIQIAIAAHHGKLSMKHSERWRHDENKRYRFLWKSYKELSYLVSDNEQKFKKSIINNYYFSAARSYLKLADYRASIKEENLKSPEFKNFEYYFNKEWIKRPVQKIAEENWAKDLLLLRAPTGAGKTDACLLWAKKQIDNGRADRLVIAMPTRFTSNALAISISENLSETGLYHSSAWFVKNRENSEDDYFNKQEHEYARLLETPITVCTIDHLLISLTHTREDHHSITFNLANSCVVIDEADFYDEFTQANILVLLEYLQVLNVPVLIMSATLPESSLKMYKKTGYLVQDIKEDKSDNTRYKCNINTIRNYENLNEIKDLLIKARTHPTIIYANTIEKAIKLYNYYNDQNNVILYHSRFTEQDKLKKEDLLIKALGKDAWRENKANGIAIMTQIGEMSVNISSNYMISEICPIDRLVQRVGRLGRFFEIIGELDILIPYKNGNIYPAPYGFFENNQWTVGKPLNDTIELLKEKKYNSEEFVRLVNRIYSSISDFSYKSKENKRKYLEQIVQNWLILPSAQPQEDDTGTELWKSRDIGNQLDIFVISPFEYLNTSNKTPVFPNYKDFMFYKNQYSISLPAYLFKQAIKTNSIEPLEVFVGSENSINRIWITNNYNDEIGFFLNDYEEPVFI